MQGMAKSIAGKVDDKTLVDIVRWYRSPLGKKVATVEISANDPDAAARLQRYVAMLQSNAPSANRQQLINGISASGLATPHPPADFEQRQHGCNNKPDASAMHETQRRVPALDCHV